jgi:phenylacetate-CoA ligase
MNRAIKSAQQTVYGKNRPDDASQWPILEKDYLRTHPLDFVNPWKPVRIPAGTGGTSGIPLKLWRSIECIVAEQVFLDALLEPYGLGMHHSRMAVLRADTVKSTDDIAPPYGRLSHGGKRLTLSVPHLNPDTLPWFHDALQRFNPSILWVYPSAVVNLLTLLDRTGLRLSIPVIMTSSEMLSGSTHQALEQYFNCTVVNYYGQAERSCFAFSTKPNEFYFNPAYGRVELTISKSNEGSTEHCAKIIGTHYWNHVMPLMRYNTGDFIYVPKEYGEKELSEIAAGTRPFSGLAGRDGEYVITKDGMRIIGLNQIPREIEHVSQMQLIQSDFNTLHINVLAMPGFSPKDARQILDQAKAKLPHTMEVSVQAVDCLQKTLRGKTPLIIRTFSQRPD